MTHSAKNPYAPPGGQPAPTRRVQTLDPPQTARFQLTEQDHVAAGNYANQHSPEIAAMLGKYRRRWSIIGVVLISCGLAIHLAAPNAPVFSKIPLFVAGVMLLISAAIYPLRLARIVRRRMRLYVRSGVIRVTDEEHLVTLDQHGVRSVVPHIETLVGWPKIDRVRATPDHLFLFWQPVSPITVPARAFFTEEGFQAFCRLAERLWEEHHHSAQE